MYAVIAFNTGLRAGDIIPLKVEDVKDRTHIYLREQKTGKIKYFPINQYMREEIDYYVKYMEENDFLFPSRQRNSKGVKSHISRTQAYRYTKQVAVELGIKDFGLHSFRKTFGYFYYKRTKDIATLMEIFNHSSQKTTKRYIGMTQDQIDESLKDFFL